jgi:hypothetical protein
MPEGKEGNREQEEENGRAQAEIAVVWEDS